MRRLAGLLVIPITLLLVPFGCRQVLGVEDRSQGSVVGQCGGYRYPTAECAECMDAECCDELEACDKSAGCDSEFACMLPCRGDDSACVAQCYTYAGLGSSPDRLPVVACRTARCAVPCGSTCGDRFYGSAACEACMTAGCCDELLACSLNVDCYSDASEAQKEAVTSCAGNVCGGECGGATWGCLDVPRAWLTPSTSGNVTIEIQLYSVTTQEPWVGVELRACALPDVSCVTPLATDTTGLDGSAQLSVPLGDTGFSGYVEITSEAGAENPLYPGIVTFSTPPIVQEGARRSFPWPSVEEFAGLTNILSVDLDPERGHVLLAARDCFSAVAAGVSYASTGTDGQTAQYYFVQQLPSREPTATSEPLALGGFVNVIPGVAVVHGVVDGKEFGELSILVRPGTLTLSTVIPGP